ncbi:MAG: M23 family metallopeptidase [Alistipes sp.]
MRRFYLIALSIFPLALAAQTLQPADYIYPVREVEGVYSANFGEIRPGHFHSGVDIKTDGVTGKTVVAVADGYISRIFVSPNGFGRALYITHTNGTISVLGHLAEFRRDIEDYVRMERYRQQKSRVDLYCVPHRFSVRQGDIVAYSGNSGGSFGPHLHYEIRNAKTQKTLNIIQQGIIRPADQIPPYLVRIHYIGVDTLRGVPMHDRPCSYDVVKAARGTYKLADEKRLPVGRKGYFLLEVSDRKDHVSNTFGVYRVSEVVDGEKIFEYRMDGFTFNLSRYSNALSYYPLQRTSRNEILRMAQLDGATGNFYPVVKNRGLITVTVGEQKVIRMEAEDDCGNVSHIEFSIEGQPETFIARADSLGSLINRDRETKLALDDELSVIIPRHALYESLFYSLTRSTRPLPEDPRILVLSPVYNVLPNTTPLHTSMIVTIRATVAPKLQPHATLATRSQQGFITYVGGSYAHNAATVRTRTTGELFIVADTLAPIIKPQFTAGADLTKATGLTFHLSDNFSGINFCEMTIDGKWVPCDRYPMQDLAIHVFDIPASGQQHTVRIRAGDGCHNTAVWQGEFYR